MRRLLSILLLLLLGSAAAQAAPPRPRPYSGSGVLAVKADPSGEPAPLVMYQEPGVLRVAELERGALPRLAGSAAEPLLAVSARRGEWLRLAYDEAGREAWLKKPRAWSYLTWQEFLPGRPVRLLPGLKKGLYLIRGQARDEAPESGTLTRDQAVLPLQVEGDWARLQGTGWFRWRDGDGRLTISLPETE